MRRQGCCAGCLCLLLCGVMLAGCAAPGEQAVDGAMVSRSERDVCDRLVGWYHLPGMDWRTGKTSSGLGTLIGVIKRGEAYYTICHGIEVPLEASPAGLTWPVHASSMKGTVIGYDSAADEYFIRIFDSMADMNMSEVPELSAWENGKQRTLDRIDRPAWIPDATAKPPAVLDDFVANYTPLWIPGFVIEIRKRGTKYYQRVTGVHQYEEEAKPLMPLEDALGFWLPDGGGRQRLIYAPERQRYELILQNKDESLPAVSMPLIRMSFEAIGVPSWRG